MVVPASITVLHRHLFCTTIEAQQEANKPTPSQQANKSTTCQQANNAERQANKPTSQQANKQANKPTNRYLI
jgi:hypothetical protein